LIFYKSLKDFVYCYYFMDVDLIKRNVSEIVTEDELSKVLKLKSPVAYCGYEPNGPMHLGHFVTITKLIDLEKAGFKIKILLADIHAMLNRKGDEDAIVKEVLNWKKTIKAIGLKAEVIVGSSYQFGKEYQLDVLKLAQRSTITRGLRSMSEIARDIENATISQLLYPLMQAVDIKHLGVNVAVGGMEQRKVHMIGRDYMDVLAHEFVAFHTPLITSLKGPGSKMSKSIPGSGIFVVDSSDTIKKHINGAYCPVGVVKDNPVLQIAQLILFPHFNALNVKRPEKFGGDLVIETYSELEKLYSSGKLHPADLKSMVIKYLDDLISPIRAKWSK